MSRLKINEHGEGSGANKKRNCPRRSQGDGVKVGGGRVGGVKVASN